MAGSHAAAQLVDMCAVQRYAFYENAQQHEDELDAARRTIRGLVDHNSTLCAERDEALDRNRSLRAELDEALEDVVLRSDITIQFLHESSRSGRCTAHYFETSTTIGDISDRAGQLGQARVSNITDTNVFACDGAVRLFDAYSAAVDRSFLPFYRGLFGFLVVYVCLGIGAFLYRRHSLPILAVATLLCWIPRYFAPKPDGRQWAKRVYYASWLMMGTKLCALTIDVMLPQFLKLPTTAYSISSTAVFVVSPIGVLFGLVWLARINLSLKPDKFYPHDLRLMQLNEGERKRAFVFILFAVLVVLDVCVGVTYWNNPPHLHGNCLCGNTTTPATGAVLVEDIYCKSGEFFVDGHPMAQALEQQHRNCSVVVRDLTVMISCAENVTMSPALTFTCCEPGPSFPVDNFRVFIGQCRCIDPHLAWNPFKVFVAMTLVLAQCVQLYTPLLRTSWAQRGCGRREYSITDTVSDDGA